MDESESFSTPPAGADPFPKFPSELKTLTQWVCRDDKKIPKNPFTGANASVKDPSTWSDFATAVAAATSKGFAGVGFVLTADDNYCAVDLDHCCPEPGAPIEPWALEIISDLNSYTEFSPSKTGVHIWVRAKLAGKGHNKKKLEGTAAVEVYDRERYLTVTGDAL